MLVLYDELNSDEFNAEKCRPGSDLGRHFSADPNFDFFRGLYPAREIIWYLFYKIKTAKAGKFPLGIL